MATNLTPLSISAPGFYGLNSQEASVDLPINWALEALNCVIDQYGRIAARKGWTVVTTTTPVVGNIETIFEYKKIDGTTEIISCAGNKIYKGTTTLTDLVAPGTITSNNWKIINFNNKAYFFQSGHVPLEYDGSTIGYITRSHTAWTASTAFTVGTIRRPTTATPYYYVCTTAGTSGATAPIWSTTVGGTTTDNTVIWTTYEVPKGDTVLGALGRLWVGGAPTTPQVVYYSDTLVGHDFYSGSSGSIDLSTVWTNGVDSISSIETYNGLLVIFAKKSIILYEGAADPSSMYLKEHIKGIGCISRNSIQDIGDDLLFLSDKGLISFGRVVQEGGSTPMNDVSANIRDLLNSYRQNEVLNDIRSTYNEGEGFYLLNFPIVGLTFYFDVRSKLEDGTFRCATWNNITPYGLYTTKDNITYIGKETIIGKYSGYKDDYLSYTFKYTSTWQHLEIPSQLKFPKSLEITLSGGFAGYLNLFTKYDYKSTSTLYQKYFLGLGGGTDLYTTYKHQLIGSGRTFQFSIQTTIFDYPLSIQRIDILTKLGRIL
ncbi:MAG: hypothetical protein RBT52_08300 [Sulfurimonas sp.]|jgi:hypothetical protein|nr:hypothetical protein [Sulfurimonas sp.]